MQNFITFSSIKYPWITCSLVSTLKLDNHIMKFLSKHALNHKHTSNHNIQKTYTNSWQLTFIVIQNDQKVQNKLGGIAPKDNIHPI